MTTVERVVASAVVALAALATAAGAARAETRRYAVIVAHTGDAEEELAPLEFADDDAARYYELFGQIADVTRVYTVLDDDSQALYPKVARAARVPKRSEVLAGLGDAFEQMAEDVADGDDVVFYFVLVGHGKVGDGGEGYVSLFDGAFTRTDLFQEVLAKSPATTNHVIVDACNAYYLVHRRGAGDATDDGGPSRRAAIATFIGAEDLEQYPNTGVLLSTSSEKETHEWSVYRAGVFSHELRSALAGGGDVNGDGLVEYTEVEAFLAAANQHVTDPEARIEVFARAPAVDRARPLIDLRAARFPHWLHVPAGDPLRIYLEDARGVRYVDAHLSGERAMVLGLVPSAAYHVRSSDDRTEARIELADAPRIELDRGAMKRAAVSARGAVEESFRNHLYQEPFGPGFYRGFTAARGGGGVDLDAPAWRPGPADATFVDAELRRLNAAARGDHALRTRLRAIAVELARALDASDHEGALQLLRGVQPDP